MFVIMEGRIVSWRANEMRGGLEKRRRRIGEERTYLIREERGTSQLRCLGFHLGQINQLREASTLLP
jgi:hypothetical protein